MFNLVLSYLFLFLFAGAVGLAIGWFLRDLIVAGRVRTLRGDIDDFRRIIAERRAHAVYGARPAQPTATTVEFEELPHGRI
jgi:hypothetical protein